MCAIDIQLGSIACTVIENHIAGGIDANENELGQLKQLVHPCASYVVDKLGKPYRSTGNMINAINKMIIILFIRSFHGNCNSTSIYLSIVFLFFSFHCHPTTKKKKNNRKTTRT